MTDEPDVLISKTCRIPGDVWLTLLEAIHPHHPIRVYRPVLTHRGRMLSIDQPWTTSS